MGFYKHRPAVWASYLQFLFISLVPFFQSMTFYCYVYPVILRTLRYLSPPANCISLEPYSYSILLVYPSQLSSLNSTVSVVLTSTFAPTVIFPLLTLVNGSCSFSNNPSQLLSIFWSFFFEICHTFVTSKHR